MTSEQQAGVPNQDSVDIPFTLEKGSSVMVLFRDVLKQSLKTGEGVHIKDGDNQYYYKFRPENNSFKDGLMVGNIQQSIPNEVFLDSVDQFVLAQGLLDAGYDAKGDELKSFSKEMSSGAYTVFLKALTKSLETKEHVRIKDNGNVYLYKYQPEHTSFKEGLILYDIQDREANSRYMKAVAEYKLEQGLSEAGYTKGGEKIEKLNRWSSAVKRIRDAF